MNYLKYFANSLNLSTNHVEIIQSMMDNMFPSPKLDKFQEKGWEKLGEGYYLVPLEDLDNNRSNYSYLYKEDNKISDKIFRKGGLGGNWKGDYIDLIVYTKKKLSRTGKPPKSTDPKWEFSSGIHCVVNKDGIVVYEAERMTSYPYLYGGCLLGVDNTIRNLKTNTIILKYGGSILKSDKFLFVQNEYNKDYKQGVYKIEIETGNFEVFEIIK